MVDAVAFMLKCLDYVAKAYLVVVVVATTVNNDWNT